jgi:hypothetical protein
MVLDRWILNGAAVSTPHVWGEETDLRWEGPAVYTTEFTPAQNGWLLFHGVSALARVFIGGRLICEHLGIWDAFSVRVPATDGRPISLSVEVTKNGGKSIPISSIASGFLPFVFGAFGGIYKAVEWIECEADPLQDGPINPVRTAFDGHRMIVDGEPVYLRGILHWGWYPQFRHPNPDRSTCRDEIAKIKALGFNCVKFCLWIPPHHYFEELDSQEMLAWVELPLWNPGSNLPQYRREIERIIKQIRRHRSIVLWTIGCEMGNRMSASDRSSLFDLVKQLTGGAPVKDSSGGAEMYGGSPDEFGDFEDFHPYCDLEQYPDVLQVLESGPRKPKAVLLGECNDFDSHRQLPKIAEEAPYWASANESLNDQGVRWQYDLPAVLQKSRFATAGEAHLKLLKNSLELKLFVHRMFQEWARSKRFTGNVVTGLSDTPISSSGFLDDWGQLKFNVDEVQSFMGPKTLFLLPQRRLPWVAGGNRVSRYDGWHYFEGRQRIRVALFTETSYRGTVRWQIGSQGGEAFCEVEPLEASEILDIYWQAGAGSHELVVEIAGLRQLWPLECVSHLTESESNAPLVLCRDGDLRAPMLRECAYLFNHNEIDAVFSGRPHTLFAALSDTFMSRDSLPEDAEVLMSRIDTRTYTEGVVVARVGDMIHSTLRAELDPQGAIVSRMLLRL